MSRTFQTFLICAFTWSISACSSNSADPVAASANARPETVVEKVTIPAGTRLHVALIDAVGSAKSSPGDEFMASLIEPIVVDGKTVVTKGTKVHGRVADVNESGRVKGRASMSLILTSMMPGGKNIVLKTKPFVVVADATKKRDAAVVGGGAGIGAAIGAIAGGKKGAGIGALVGGGAGTGTVLATKGKDINYPPETRLSFTLANPLVI